MNPLAKQLLDDLRCPICKGKIDLVDWKLKYASKKYNFCCANNWEHYRFFLVHWEADVKLEQEIVIIYDGDCKYEIIQNDISSGKNNQMTVINVYAINAENRMIENQSAKVYFKPTSSNIFNYNYKLFDFALTNREKIINRVKTILVFQ